MDSAIEVVGSISSAVRNKNHPLTQPSRTHAFVKFNNQNSVLLNKYLSTFGIWCLLHDNRIFAFRKPGDSRRESRDDVESNDDDETMATSSQGCCEKEHQELAQLKASEALVLEMLTTPKYRALSALYLIFGFLDNLSFILLIILTILNGDKLTVELESSKIALYSVFATEIYYDIMLFTAKYWTLQRVSIFVGSGFFAVYAGMIHWNRAVGVFAEKDMLIVWGVFCVRLIAFILEELVDIGIDCLIHNDLLRLQDNSTALKPNGIQIQAVVSVGSEEDPLLVKTNHPRVSYLDVTKAIQIPENVQYVGSIFAWGLGSVHENKWKTDKFSTYHPVLIFLWLISIVFFIFIFIPVGGVLLLVVVVLLGIVYVVCLMAEIVACCCCCSRKNYCKSFCQMLPNYFKELSEF